MAGVCDVGQQLVGRCKVEVTGGNNALLGQRLIGSLGKLTIGVAFQLFPIVLCRFTDCYHCRDFVFLGFSEAKVVRNSEKKEERRG